MKVTSAQAAKRLKQYNEELNHLLKQEKLRMTFHAASTEDPEKLRPEYDYLFTQTKIEKKQDEIRKLKHSINVFNATHVIPEFNMTVDQMLIYIPQLTARVEKLEKMKSLLPRQRVDDSFGRNTYIIDYIYANYEIEAVEGDYERLSKELSNAQLALDTFNNTELFEPEGY